jgi:hypothetical protein
MKRLLSLLLLLPVLAACEEDPAGPGNAHVGVYTLESINGDEVPASFEEDGGVFTIIGATLTLNANGSFAMNAEMEFTIDDETTEESNSIVGTYTRSGNTLTFTHSGEDEGFDTATLSGDVLTTSGGGDEVLVFEK